MCNVKNLPENTGPTEINQIDAEKQIKQQALVEKQQERQLIEKDKTKKEKSYQKFKKEEQALVAQLKED